MKKVIAIVAAAIVLSGCSANWGWYVVDPSIPKGMSNLEFLLSGLYYTVLLSVTAISISVIVGLLIALPGPPSSISPDV